MQKKCYISVLVIILAFLGISQDQTVVPNQEMVLQFADGALTSQKAQNTIAIVKQQLEAIGVDNIQLQEKEHGQLVIAYYSTTDVASIKKILSEEKQLDLTYSFHNEKESKFPLDKQSSHYNIDVYEIQKGSDSGLGLGGKYVFELKQEYVRFYNPNVFLYATLIDAGEKDHTVKVAYTINKNIAIAIDNTSYKIPEVRAGPNC